MSHKRETRQFAALGRLLEDVTKYCELIKNPPATLTVKEVVLKDKEVMKHLTDKLTKAEKCVNNLKANGVYLQEKE